MTTDRVRLSTYLSTETEQRARIMAKARGLSVSQLLRQALGLMQFVDDADKQGHSVGTARDRSNLETVFVPPL